MKPAEPSKLFLREYTRLRNRIVWSWQGMVHAFKTEHSLRSWVYANVISAGLAFWLPITPTQTMVIVVLGLLVVVAELFNTALERLSDLISPDHHELAGQAKDTASAAVALTAITAGVAWVFALVGWLV